MRRAFALVYGLLCHTLFAAGVGAMALALYCGLLSCGLSSCGLLSCGLLSCGLCGRADVGLSCELVARGTATGAAAWAWNLLLALHFPFIHSFLLGRRGARLLGGDLATTTYATIAAADLLAVFVLWSPSGTVWWQASGAVHTVLTVLFIGSWLFLGLAIRDAGLALQTGHLGWWAVFRGRRPRFGPMPEDGLFRLCRQPVYLGFALTLWTGPVWTPDHLLLAGVWTLYCLIGPLFKERRYTERYGDAFRRYRARMPYWLPLGARHAQ